MAKTFLSQDQTAKGEALLTEIKWKDHFIKLNNDIL